MASVGTIVTYVFTSGAQIPIPGATVVITQKGPNGLYSPLSVRVSDQSGKNAPVEVRTPDLAVGLSPGGIQPFSLVDVWVETPGFEVLRVENVQIFPYTQTIQGLELIPLPEQVSPTARAEIIQTPPQSL